MRSEKNSGITKEVRKEERVDEKKKRTEREGTDVLGTVIEVAFGITLLVVTVIGVTYPALKGGA